MSGHTEGPWIAAGHGDYSDYDGNCIVVLGEGGDIRTAIVLGIGDEAKANAFLIAAAPDLLASLIEVTELLNMMLGVSGGFPPGADGPAVKAASAIARATGVQS